MNWTPIWHLFLSTSTLAAHFRSCLTLLACGPCRLGGKVVYLCRRWPEIAFLVKKYGVLMTRKSWHGNAARLSVAYLTRVVVFFFFGSAVSRRY
jgi:hypothetical protein